MNLKTSITADQQVGFPETSEDVLRWRIASECAGQCIWDHDFELDRHFLSSAWRDMRGWSDDDLPALSTEDWLKTIHPDDVAHLLHELARQESGETDEVKYEFRQRHSDGRWIWILSRGRIVRRDAEGQPARIIGIDLDITDMKSVEDERHRLGERLGIALRAAQMARWEYKLGCETTLWDDRALEIFGIADGQNERPAVDFENAIHPDDRAETMTEWLACMEHKVDVSCDFRIIRPDGTERFIRTTGSYVDDGNGDGCYCGVNIDLTEDYQKTVSLEQTRSQLHHDSRHDALTGLANRRHLDEAFQEARDPTGRPRRMAAMHIDIDHFKPINDTLGHEAGDAVLQHVANELRKLIPDDAMASRVGGDEFVVFFATAPNTESLKSLARLLINQLAAPMKYGHDVCKVGISVGIAEGQSDDPDQRSLFVNADLALYRAKKNGRGSFSVFNARMLRDVRRRRLAQEKLRGALERGELVCFYQPQYEAQNLTISGAEALVRWECPDQGLLGPDVFLGPAAEMGLSSEIDDLVLKQAINDLKSWDDAGLHLPRISVNLSAQRVSDPMLGDHLSRLNIPRNRLAFELLESTFLDSNDDVVTANLKIIRDLGISIEVDDFGTGHASIVSLLRIKPDRLKIDRALVDPIVTSTNRRRLLESLMKIGQLLDVTVIAEGVESSDHIKLLQDMGCAYLQGFALARPMPKNDLTELLR